MHQPLKIVSETSSASQSTADWYRQVFAGVSGTSVTVTENGGDLPSNPAKIQIVKNGVILAITEDYTVVEPNINFVEALDDDNVIVTFLSDEETTSTLVDDIITAADAKKHVKVDLPDDDDLIQMYIKAARQVCEEFIDGALVPKTIDEQLQAWPTASDRAIRLSKGPIIQVDTIKYYDTDGNEQTIASTDSDFGDKFIVETIANYPAIVPKASFQFPDLETGRLYPITIRYQSGYNSTDLVPQPIKQAMLLLIGKFYENRVDSVQKLPTAAEYLLNAYKTQHFG